ncbi:methyl-accepting chemotaxis protein [Oleispirillum naphthae]|uniref:methyl-accepting chemotaxis protein n=1 Tax=Oleispirillum naphthae TaxID=2838853 RepID=UPI0030823B6E
MTHLSNHTPAASAEDAGGDAEYRRMAAFVRQSLALIEAFEHEVKGNVADTVRQSAAIEQAAADGIAAVGQVGDQTGVAAEASKGALANVQTVAAACQQLAASEHQVDGLVHRAADLATEAVDKAGHASDTVARLAEALKAVSGIVGFIEEIARRTNMLALNATIEAQRAGAAGKGFAVVANEVKDLSKQTAGATRDIRDKIGHIGNTSGEVTAAIGVIAAAVREIRDITAEVAGAVQQHAEATGEISRNAHAVAERVSEVSDSIGAIAQEAAQAQTQSEEVARLAAASASRLDGVDRRLGAVLDKYRSADHSIARLPLDLPAALAAEGRETAGRLTEITAAGGRFAPEGEIAGLAGAALRLPWFGEMPVAAARSGNEIALRFEPPPGGAQAAAIRRLIDGLDFCDVEMLGILADAQREVTQALEDGLRHGRLSLADLFDEDYQPVPGTNPTQYTNRCVAFAEQAFVPIQERHLARSERLVAVVTVDRNGYMPVNNLYCSKPQTADPVWNAANSRFRIFLKDHASARLYESREPFLFHTYIREVAPNTMVLFKGIGMPIVIDRRPWGVMRVTYHL